MKKERPILFSTPMVQAILEGRKTQTRRIMKPQLYQKDGWWHWDGKRPKAKVATGAICSSHFNAEGLGMSTSPYGLPGDMLWVRETFYKHEYDEKEIMYEASFQEGFTNGSVKWKKKPSIHMPRTAARIFLEISNVRVERLQDISEADAIAEGIECVGAFDSGEGVSKRAKYKNYLPHGYTEVLPRDSFMSLWIHINGQESLDANPFVWIIEFKRKIN